ncbi:MAG: transcriptional repressor [Chloroflexota bacterium]
MIAFPYLRERGYWITPQREMIIEAIARNPCHFTAGEIYTEIQCRVQSLNIATVCPTPERLVEEG